MARQLKPFDHYVKEAQREPVEIVLGENDVITVNQPTGEVWDKVMDALVSGDRKDLAKALLGPKDGAKLLKLTQSAPAPVLSAILSDVLTEFRVEDPGDSEASPTS